MRYTTRNGRPLALWVAAGAGAAVLACADVTEPRPRYATPLVVPSHYAAWWSMVEQCAGVTRPMSQISWFQNGEEFRVSTGELVRAVYRRGPSEIILVSAYVLDGPLVRHEMLHAILNRSSTNPQHPREYYLGRCAGVVACEGPCVETAEPADPIPLGTPEVEPSWLEVTVTADSVVSFSRYPGLRPGFGNATLGYTSVVVHARNPSAHGVNVRLPSTLLGKLTFAGSARGPSGTGAGAQAYSDDLLAGFFRAGETRSHVIDLYLGWAPGNWSVEGAFAGNITKTLTSFRLGQ